MTIVEPDCNHEGWKGIDPETDSWECRFCGWPFKEQQPEPRDVTVPGQKAYGEGFAILVPKTEEEVNEGL